VALVAELAASGKYPDAASVVTELERLPPPASEDPRVELAEATVAHETDLPRSERAATRAAANAQARGDRLLLAHALVAQGDAVSLQGRFAEAIALFERAGHELSAAGDRASFAETLYWIGDTDYKLGDDDGALSHDREAVAIYREVGDVRRIADALGGIASVLRRKGDFAGARKMREEALAYIHQSGLKRAEGTATMNLANVVLQQGDLAAAVKLYRDARALLHDAGARGAEAVALANLGNALGRLGDLGEAVEALEQAVAQFQDVGERADEVWARLPLAYSLCDLGRNEDAQKQATLARDLARALGDGDTAGGAGDVLSTTLLIDGKWAEAEALARTVLTELRPDDGTLVQVTETLVWALLQEGKLDQLGPAVAAAEAHRAKLGEAGYIVTLDEVGALVSAATGHTDEAAERIGRLIEQAAKDAGVSPQRRLELRRVLGEIELRAGKRAQGTARLAAVTADARRQGLVEMARRAARQEPGYLLPAHQSR
jgi:tetratricopeptide (TPR) repeat protein